jgi:hypothetical protein
MASRIGRGLHWQTSRCNSPGNQPREIVQYDVGDVVGLVKSVKIEPSVKNGSFMFVGFSIRMD